MNQIWDHRCATVRETVESLNGHSDKQRAYTTIMSTMQRLCEKGVLTRRRQGKTDVYEPRVSREEYRKLRADAEVGALVEQYGDAALVNFAQRMASLDPKRRQALNRLARRV